MIKDIINKILGKPKEAMSFQASMDLTNMPIVTFYQGEKKFNFLLDTGSTSSVIATHVLDTIEHEKIDEPAIVYGMEGRARNVQKCNITLSYKGNDYTCVYLINDMAESFRKIKVQTGVTIHGILGCNFFNKFKYVLDFDELIAYSKR